ncbi:MAG: peptidoglycan editing factor PgeF [Desulfatibacillaceae bacterium]|nr:peptidoglycan editing factor PgeF [Desulfatibacillaceae bacterium]
MLQKEANNLTMFEFKHLAGVDGLCHGVFTRLGGVSLGPFEALNAGRSTGDDPVAVETNLNLALDTMGDGVLALANQVHGRRAVCLDAPENADRIWLVGQDADALVTDRPGIFLGVTTADCQPILICDPHFRVVAAVHAGWRGSVANVAAATIAVMRENYGCRPRNLLVGVGPSLGPCCAQFVNYKSELPESFWFYRKGDNHFDFWAITRHQLLLAGVPLENISFSGRCTLCQGELFYSFRRNKTTGRFLSAIGFGKSAN